MPSVFLVLDQRLRRAFAASEGARTAFARHDDIVAFVVEITGNKLDLRQLVKVLGSPGTEM